MVSLVASRNACVCVCVELVPAAHICDSAVHFFGEAFFVAFFFVLFLAFFTAFGLVTFLVAFFDALGMVRERESLVLTNNVGSMPAKELRTCMTVSAQFAESFGIIRVMASAESLFLSSFSICIGRFSVIFRL